MDQKEMHEIYDILFALLKSGPRNNTIAVIAEYLRKGDEQSARSVYGGDGDKIATTIYQKEIEKYLGCRLHGRHNCDGPFCRKFQKKPLSP